MSQTVSYRRAISHSSLRRKIRIEIRTNINTYGDASGRCLMHGSYKGLVWSCGWHVVSLDVAGVRRAAKRHRDNHVADAIYNNGGYLRPWPPPQRPTEHLRPLECFL
jgi:hypothetical protein